MANYCEICGKHTATGFNVSHSHLKTKRTWKPNIVRRLPNLLLITTAMRTRKQRGCSFCKIR